MARAIPPLPPANVPMAMPDGTMSPIWRIFWVQLLLALGDINKVLTLGDFANDAAAAVGGVAVGQYYRNGSVVMIRVV